MAQTKKKVTLSTLTEFLDRLDRAGVHYSLGSVNEGGVMIVATVGEERWEVEFLKSGKVEIEIFESDGEVHDQSMLEELFERHLDAQ